MNGYEKVAENAPGHGPLLAIREMWGLWDSHMKTQWLSEFTNDCSQPKTSTCVQTGKGLPMLTLLLDKWEGAAGPAGQMP